MRSWKQKTIKGTFMQKILMIYLFTASPCAFAINNVEVVLSADGITCEDACSEVKRLAVQELTKRCPSGVANVQFSAPFCNHYDYTDSCDIHATAVCK